jgi:hypothetical protein
VPGRLSALPECLVLAALLHLLLVAVFGSAPGGSARPGEGVWGSLNIRIAGTGPARSEPAEQPPPPDAYSGPPGQAPERRWGGTVRDPAALPPADTPGAARLGTWNPARTAAEADPLPPALARPAAPADTRSPPRAAPAPAPAPLPSPPPAGQADAPQPVPAAGTAIPEPAARDATAEAPAVAPTAPPEPESAPPPVLRELRATAPLRPVAPLPALRGPMAPLEAPAAAAPALAPLPPQTPVAEPSPAPAPAPAEAPTRTLGAAPALTSPTALPLRRPETLPALPAPATAPVLADVPRDIPRDIPLAPSPSGVPSAPAPETAAAPAPTPERALPARAALGAPDAGAIIGHDVATAPAAPASAPRLNLDLVRPRGGEISSAGSRGVLNLLPHPPETKKLADDISKSARPDCRTAYSGMGIIAAVPLAADALRKEGCRW